MTFLKRVLALTAVLAVLAIINGLAQPLYIHVPYSDLEAADNDDRDYGPAPLDRPFVGLAFSGGGARAAAFSAAGLVALTRTQVPLDDITHISSVSGGGFTASYLALHPPTGCTGPEDTAGCDAYLAQILAQVAPPSFYALDLRQARHPWRILSPSRRLVSLTEELDRADFLAGRTFADLPTDRRYYFNTVSYDTGQPFVFSNAILPDAAADAPGALPPELRSLSFSTDGTARSSPASLSLSLAVATSAAFPPYLGPTSIEWEKDKTFWHLGDGGIVENTGLATLIEAAHASGATAATLYVFDGGQRLDQAASIAARDISVFSSQMERIVDILNIFGGVWRTYALERVAADAGITLDVKTFSYQDIARAPETFPDWAAWPAGGWMRCDAGDDTPATRLLAIPTRLSITDCNRDLITAAAEALVAAAFAPPTETTDAPETPQPPSDGN
ncbi:patatin-like phospholipase family protein [Pseudooctadecabacter jejudonensis]|uniref:Patatin-like phospholipase n=1 Tax=Pseudooctadecabacter jejudonensis TaxID=1391910 RepID=A0A1Y5TI44_9RHOB|nr:patatin-like phospholipase family protein [Pseudooctadecabacter jejudonensis]SLN60846.1 Patatin-like phospholipase [Pseudooctadecabacter jejudonensis]